MADHATDLFKEMFKDSPTAQNYAMKATKQTALVRGLGEAYKSANVATIQRRPFSLSTDGSNGANSKLYPILTYVFDEKLKRIEWKLISIPALGKTQSATAEHIFQLLDSELMEHCIAYNHVIALSVDNTNTMVGHKKGLYGRFKEKHCDIHLAGCLCHLINLATQAASSELNIGIDDLLVDIFYYFRKSDKRKAELTKLQEFYDTDL